MKDFYDRNINYLRISLTDRCNLCCRYCMPDGIACISHHEILTYEELLRIAKAAVRLGITAFKVTGGEPLVRKGSIEFIQALKAVDGVKSVTLTTNGVLLEEKLEHLQAAGVDGINISLDTTNRVQYQHITGGDYLEQVKRGMIKSCRVGITTKINSVLLKECGGEIEHLAGLAERYPVDVRFIELMPIGIGALGGGISQLEARSILVKRYPDLSERPHPLSDLGNDRSEGLCGKAEKVRVGNGPAHYEYSKYLIGRIGWIDAMSHKFCRDCNRIRLTSDGMLKPCLCFGEHIDVKAALRRGCTDDELLGLLMTGISQKPMAHCFEEETEISEHRRMSSIGG